MNLRPLPNTLIAIADHMSSRAKTLDMLVYNLTTRLIPQATAHACHG